MSTVSSVFSALPDTLVGDYVNCRTQGDVTLHYIVKKFRGQP